MLTTSDPGRQTAVIDQLLRALPDDRVRVGAQISERHYADWSQFDR